MTPIRIYIETERRGIALPLFSPMTGFPDPAEFDEEQEEMPEADDGEESAAGENSPDVEAVLESLGFDPEDAEQTLGEEEPERAEFYAEGELTVGNSRVEITYAEDVVTGMEGSVTTLSYDRKTPSVVVMQRTGPVDTALIFEKGVRHICVYHTPFSVFEMVICALSVRNRILETGELDLDYLIEIHGARTERCKMKIRIE